MALSVHDLELAQHLGVEPALGPLTPTPTTYWWANWGSHIGTQRLWQAHAHKGAVRPTNDRALLVPHHARPGHVRDVQLQPPHRRAKLERVVVGGERSISERVAIVDVVRARASHRLWLGVGRMG